MGKNILFVCKWNRFRSKVAEAFFNKYNKNSKNKAKSAGVVRGHLPLDKKEVTGAKEFDINLSGKPHGLTSELMHWQNIMIIVANDVPAVLFEHNRTLGKDLVVWKIKDNVDSGEEEIKKIIKQIEGRVKKLVEELK